jgi:glyoxylate utilization-related uncharacterized protein
MNDTMQRDDLGDVIFRTTHDIWAMDWEPLRDLDGVGHKVLWQSGAVTVGLIRVEPGAEKPPHVHHHAHHHIWIVSGAATMLGQRITASSYLYIPPGIVHEVTDVGPEGCVFFYSHRPVEIPRPRDEIIGEIPAGF